MFCRDNLFVAESEEHIIGLVLWHQGPMLWDSDIYRSCGGDSDHIEDVESQYFASYQNVPPSTVSLLNICISRDVRGQGIGGKMLDAFLCLNNGPFELYVLADNPVAIKMYQTKGFRITDQIDGFSLGNIKPLCYKMERPGDFCNRPCFDDNDIYRLLED